MCVLEDNPQLFMALTDFLFILTPSHQRTRLGIFLKPIPEAITSHVLNTT